MERVMRCKLVLNGCEKVAIGQEPRQRANGTTAWVPKALGCRVKMGAVWEGKEEQAKSENAVFGEMTPMASFEAQIHNPEVAKRFEDLYGREFYVDFVLVPIGEKPDTPAA